jgi:hypothetical protein
MARSWSGFLPQNDAMRQLWTALAEVQDETTEVVDWEAPKPEPKPEDEGSQAEPDSPPEHE